MEHKSIVSKRKIKDFISKGIKLREFILTLPLQIPQATLFMYHFQIKAFDELSTREFHDLLQLRIGVFIVEQNCPYPELDGKDLESFHVIGRSDEGKTVATARILPQGISYPEVSIGRVSSHPDFRSTGLGHRLMDEIHAFIRKQFGNVPVRISAQAYLLEFYEKHGYISTGKEYLEDDIPHVEMVRGGVGI